MPIAYSKRLTTLIAAAIAFGILLSCYWGSQLDLHSAWERLRQIRLPNLGLFFLIALPALGLRMLRWHFFLRNSGFMVRPLDSARIFLAALVMIMTPGYVGEIIKSYWLRRSYGIAMRSSIPLVFFERFFDVLAIATYFVIFTWFQSWAALAMLGIISLGLGLFWHFFCPLCVRLASLVGRLRLFLFLRHSPGETPPDIRLLRRPYFFALAFALSLLAWSPGAIALKIIFGSMGEDIAIADSVRIFSGGTLLGGLSLLPGGIAVSSSWFIRELQQAGFAASDAILGGALLRFLTLWFAFGIGVAAYALTMRRGQAMESLEKALHFDQLAPIYDAQIPEHMRRLLVERKTSHMLGLLEAQDRSCELRGLDVGCGHGWYMEHMTRSGYGTAGCDRSIEQARQAMRIAKEVAVADATALPYRDATFDFAYSINVLHHLAGREMQQRAFEEIARVLKPGGWFFLHEINVRNPLFRFYAGYVFPLINDIDEGIEFWIRARDLARYDSLFTAEQTDYFTFMPDFMPKSLLDAGRKIEAILESTPARVWSAHYMVALRRKR